jgi:hypothetical protein
MERALHLLEARVPLTAALAVSFKEAQIRGQGGNIVHVPREEKVQKRGLRAACNDFFRPRLTFAGDMQSILSMRAFLGNLRGCEVS